jgi:hypothetical protein
LDEERSACGGRASSPVIGGPDVSGRAHYSHARELAHNLPYLAMAVLGGILAYRVFGGGAPGAIATASWVAYFVFATLWFIVLVCPHCAYHGTRDCPCGYGQISAMLRARSGSLGFARAFRLNLPVMIVMWLVPPALGGLAIYERLAASGFVIEGVDWLTAGLVAAFALDAFVILPLVSRLEGCADCPQRDACPWMGKKGKCGATGGTTR